MDNPGGNIFGFFDHTIFAKTIYQNRYRTLSTKNLYAGHFVPNKVDPNGLNYTQCSASVVFIPLGELSYTAYNISCECEDDVTSKICDVPSVDSGVLPDFVDPFTDQTDMNMQQQVANDIAKKFEGESCSCPCAPPPASGLGGVGSSSPGQNNGSKNGSPPSLPVDIPIKPTSPSIPGLPSPPPTPPPAPTPYKLPFNTPDSPFSVPEAPGFSLPGSQEPRL
jgi:hypothetical protein